MSSRKGRFVFYASLFVLFSIMVSLVVYDFYRRNNIEWATISKSGEAMLDSGDIIFTQGESFKSDVVRLFSNVKGCNFSHCGILTRERGDLYVVHMSIDEGCIVKESICSFLIDNKVSDFAVVRPLQTVDKRAVVRELNRLIEARVPFDNQYDATESECLYCSELVCVVYDRVCGLNFYPRDDRRRAIYPTELYKNNNLIKII